MEGTQPAFPVSDRETQTKACPECGALVTVCDHLYAIPKSGPFSDEGKALPAGSKQSTPERENGPELRNALIAAINGWPVSADDAWALIHEWDRVHA